MKTLRDLQKGDTFYLIYQDGGFISSINIKTVNDTLDIKIGRIIHYYVDDMMSGFTILKDEFDMNICKANCYEAIICSDKDTVIKLLDSDKEKYLEKWTDIKNSLS